MRRRIITDERGVSLVELSVASALLTVVLAVVLPALSNSFVTMVRQEDRAQTNDEAMLAFTQVERDVRSGNVIGAPGPIDGVAGMEVRIYTQTQGAPFRCVQYRVSDGRLERRTRPPGTAHEEAWPATWSLVADGLTNASQSPPVALFARSADRQTLSLEMLVNKAERDEAAVRLVTSITGRNTKYYDTPFAEDQCN